MTRNQFKRVPASFFFIFVCAISIFCSQTQFVRAYFSDNELAYYALEVYEPQNLEISYENGYMVMDVTDTQITELEELGFQVVAYPDYNIHHNRSEHRVEGTIPGYPSYKLVETTFAIAESLTKALPDLATLIDAGDSWEKKQGNGGYDLKVLRLTNAKVSGPKPKLIITSSIHAREYTTAELNLRFVLYCAAQYGKDPDITWMLDYHELHALFYVNPDGRKHAEKGKLWRKNTNTDYCKSDPGKRGCDMNRNFDYRWSSAGSTDECSQTFRGARAASEPEVQAVQNYLKKEFTNPDAGIYIDLHSYGEVIYKPSAMNTLARKCTYFNGYEARTARAGMTYDYGYYVVKVHSLLFELGTAFFQKCDYFEQNILPKNLPALVYCLNACRNPAEIAYGPDAYSAVLNDKTLTATIDDTRYGGSVTTQNIAAAEYYIGIPPWVNGAVAKPMHAVDGNFDEKKEKVRATIDLSELRSEKTLIYVRGKDTAGKWGAVSAVFADMTGNQIVDKSSAVGKAFAFYPPVSSGTVTVFQFHLPYTTEVKLFIYDLNGRRIAYVVNKKLAAGEHRIVWNGAGDKDKRYGNKAYIYKMHCDSHIKTGTFVMIK